MIVIIQASPGGQVSALPGKRFPISWYLLLLLAVVPVSRAEEVSLISAYGLALAQSESVQISVTEWLAAEARYRQALGEMWPEVSAKGEADWIAGEDKDKRRAGIGMTWTVFDGFRTARYADARQAEGQAWSHSVEHTRLLLYEDVADVFYQVLSFQDQRSAVKEQLRALQSRTEELQRRIRLGRSKRSDLLATSNQVAEARLTIEQLNQSHAAALELLAFLTGQASAGLQAVDRTPLPDAGDVDRYLAAAMSRPDIQAGEAGLEASQIELKAARSERAPTVTLDGNAYPLRDPQTQSEWDITLSLEMPLFDRGQRIARIAEAGQQLRISELKLAALHRSSERDVRQAYQSLFYGLRQWSELETAIGISSDTLDLFRKDCELGRVSNLDLLEASVQYWAFRRREAALAHRLRADMVHLHVAAGKGSP
jgi:outer membrane protein TolC